MQILDNFLIISLIVGSFFGGMKLSSHFHRIAAEHEKYALQRQYSRLLTRMDADDPCQPYTPPPARRRFQIPQEFADNLTRNGAASMRVEKHSG